MPHSFRWFRVLLVVGIIIFLCPSTAAQAQIGIISGQPFIICQSAPISNIVGTSLPIANPGFETLPANPAWQTCVGTGCRYTVDGNIPGWTASSNSAIGLLQPSSTYYTLPLPAAEGATISEMNNGTLSQTLTDSFQANTIYTVSVDVGRRLDNLYPSPTPTVQLYAGTVLIASATGSQPPLGGWSTWTGTYTPAPPNPFAPNPTVGSPLKIVFATTAAQANFDNVQLTVTPTSGSCTYTLNATTQSAVAAASSVTVNVTAGSGCTWTAASNVSWITITAGASGTSNGSVTLQVAANTGPSRSGTVTIAGQTVTVNQSGSSGGGGVSGTNLIVNGDAEASAASGWDVPAGKIPGWTTDGNVAVVAYTDGSGDLTPSTPGPPNPGKNYFCATPSDTAKMNQTIDISSSAANIDAGAQPYTLDGWLGGWDGQDDNSVVTATFQSASGTSLGTATIGPVLSADRGGNSELLERTATGALPAGTRKVLITVTFTRTSGSDNDSPADNLSFSLSGTVTPPTNGSTVYYRFENGTAGAAATASGSIIDSVNGQNGNPSGSLTYSSDVPLGSVADASNKLSLQIGTSGVVQFPGAFPLNTLTNGTLEFYIKPTVNASEMDFLWTSISSADSNRFNMGVLSSGNIFMDYREVNGTLHSIASIPISTSNWTHVAVVKTGNTWTGYANGAQQGQPVIDSNPNLPNNTGWTLNGRGSISYTGLIDELRISNTALTPAQFLPPIFSAKCTYTLSATSASPTATAGTVTVNVIAASGCAWTSTTTASWITISSGASGTGNGSVTLQIAANTGVARAGTVTIAGQTFTVNQAAGGQSGCSYNVNPTSLQATAAGLSGTFLIVTNTTCSWTASVPTGVSWITLSPTSGTGNGASGYSIAANTGGARTATLTVAGVSIAVSQDAAATCSYSISPSSATFSGAGGANAVSVTVVGSGCPAWTISAPTVGWLHVTSPSGQTKSGMVTYSVDPNMDSNQRGTTLAIANQTFSITQQAPTCSFSTNASSSATLPASGGTGSVSITASAGACAWSATLPSGTSSQWAHITTASNAAGSATINYSVDPNNTTSARTVILSITGQKPITVLSYTINQAAGTANTSPPPVITPGGIVNAASFISANIPAGAIAQGSFFSIFGNNLGPNPYVSATSYPLATNLGGVSISVTQGSTTVAAIPVFVAQFQINAVMPSNAPTGAVQVAVSYGGLTSPPVQTQVAVNNFAAFAVSGGRGPGIIQNYVSPTQLPLNTGVTSAAPGDTVILWGTGLGPLPNGASDTQPPTGGSLPVSVKVTVGTVNVQPTYSGRAPGLAGVDQINFVIPQNAPAGCYVPIQVVAANMASNAVTMAIAANRQACSDTNPINNYPKTGGKNATVVISRMNFTDASNPSKNGSVDLGVAVFEQQTGDSALGFDLYSSTPPRNTCTYTNNINGLNTLLVGQLPSLSGATTSLDAGASIIATGPNGTRGMSYSDSAAKTSPYFALFGAGGALASAGLTSGFTSDAPFLDPGAFAISGSGGKDVGPFSVPLTVSTGAIWTNRDQIATIDRSQPLNITWSGGDPSKQVGLILGLASNPAINVSGNFTCLVTLDQHSFSVPASMMTNLPSTSGLTGSGGVQSGLLFLTFPSGDQFTKFNTSAPPSLDNGTAMFMIGEIRSNVVYK